MNLTRIKPIYVALGAAVLGLLVMPIAVAGAAANGPKATADSTVARLEHQISRLQSRVSTLERTGSGPAGPAEGALHGSDTTRGLGAAAVTDIAPGAVGTIQLRDNAVTNAKLAANAVSTRNIVPGAIGTTKLRDNAVTNPKLAANAVSARNIAVGAIGSTQLAPGSVNRSSLASGTVDGEKLALGAVGGAALANAFPVQGPGVTIFQGETKEATVTCPDGSRLLSGGGEWSPNGRDDTAIIGSSPAFSGDPNHTWVVQARVDNGGVGDTFFPEALCLDA